MASIGVSAVRLIDGSGDPLDDDSGKLNVNATLVAGATIDIGDVDMFLDGGTAILGGAGDVASGVLRVTIAANDNVSTKLTAIDADLGYIRSSVATTATQTSNLVNFIQTEDLAHSSGDVGYMFLGVRNDTLVSLVSDDGDYTPLQVNDIGALYVTGESKQNTAVTDYGFSIMGEAKVIDGSGLPNSVSEGSASRIATSRTGIQYTHLTNDSGTASAILEEDSSHSSGDYGIMSLAVRNDALGSLAGSDGDYTPFQVNSSGALYVEVASSAALTVDLGSNNDVTVTGTVGHDITGIASDDNDTVGTSAEKISGADGDVACKRVDIMAHPDNTGYIWIGDSAVSVNGLNGGIRLSPGDFYSMDIDNTGDVYAIATVDGENVCFNYYT
jgi:hypothetical protein|tara:strand:- start:1620 stop:2777 length:1158 start_codon:yes stop_codon:yes gene_type:complete